jgi:hypothetical protein
MPALPAPLHQLVRVLRIGALIGAAAGIVRALRGSTPPPATGQATWPPLVADIARPTRSGPVRFVEAALESDAQWVDPIDGECPASHPVKGNAGSMIFHVPGGMSYERTVPERCYATEADAEADGFRRAKR